jgi:hypothetical protein
MEEQMPVKPTETTTPRLRIRELFATTLLFSSVMISSSEAGGPEYMKLDFKEVPAVEIKGCWDTSGVFVATDIEELPRAQRPKLRGEIQAVDPGNSEITMYGIRIRIDQETQVADTEKGISAIEDLEIGRRVEVSCEINSENKWEARKIKVTDIKESDKIKGSITRVAVDGAPPDTLEIHGLLILLVGETDVNEPGSFFEENESDQPVLGGADTNMQSRLVSVYAPRDSYGVKAVCAATPIELPGLGFPDAACRYHDTMGITIGGTDATDAF